MVGAGRLTPSMMAYGNNASKGTPIAAVTVLVRRAVSELCRRLRARRRAAMLLSAAAPEIRRAN